MMVVIILIGIVLAIVGGILYNIIQNTKYEKISFKESLDLTDLPIITFLIDNKKYNFLLDSGANLSVINKSILKEIPHTFTNTTGTIFGMEGNIQQVTYVLLKLHYKSAEYTSTFQVIDMDNAFSAIKQESGVVLHGILGNEFLQKYKYVLDFKELVAYSK